MTFRDIKILCWDAIKEATSYEVAYRISTSTEWTYVSTNEAKAEISGLTAGSQYIWKVRAYCTHDRVTPYSAQNRFTMPEGSAVSAISNVKAVSCGNGYISVNANGQNVMVCDTAGSVIGTVAAYNSKTFYVQPGIYVVRIGTSATKVIVR